VSDALLEADGLRVVRGGKELLRGVALRVDAGEVVGVLGPSGAGKSTLFRALVGEEPPDGGRVWLAGEDVTHWPLWRRARAGVGYVPQGPSVFVDLTVEENLETFSRVTSTAPGTARERAVAVDLEAKLNVRAGSLSAGERRRLEVARALTRRPRVLVCDEPFAGVDPAGAARIGELLRALAASGVAILLADHHVEEALRVCARALLLLDGAVALEASPDAFRRDPVVRARYLSPDETSPS